MKGIVLDFSDQTNSGVINGDDQNRYTFSALEWKDSNSPKRGDQVDFDINSEGQAVQITTALKQPFINDHSQNASSNIDNRSHPNPSEENFNMIDWFVKCLKNYVNFSGRARRKEYWFFTLAQFLILLVAMIIDFLIFKRPSVFYYIIALALWLPSLAVCIRRLHDINKSGWWFLFAFIPLIGAIMLLIWLATETKKEDNQWGQPAK